MISRRVQVCSMQTSDYVFYRKSESFRGLYDLWIIRLTYIHYTMEYWDDLGAFSGCKLQNTYYVLCVMCMYFWYTTSSVKTFVCQNIIWNAKCEEHIQESQKNIREVDFNHCLSNSGKYPDIRAKRLYFNLAVIVKLHTQSLTEYRQSSQTWHTAYHSTDSSSKTGLAPWQPFLVIQMWTFYLFRHSGSSRPTCSPRSWGWTGCKVLQRGGWSRWPRWCCGLRPARCLAGAAWSAAERPAGWTWEWGLRVTPTLYGAANTRDNDGTVSHNLTTLRFDV